MTQEYTLNTEADATPDAGLSSAHAVTQLYRNTARDTWKWLWKDTATRVVPLAAAAGMYARFSGRGPETIGLTRDHWLREVALGIGFGVPLAALAAVFRGWVAPTHRLPTPADQALQTAFYFAINAPAEEVFWRGTVQELAVRGLSAIPFVRWPGVVGWTLATGVFGAYHRLGNWSWRAIAGVTAAGALFGALYQWPRAKRSILAATIVHGFATAGFLSWGDAYLHWRSCAALRRQAVVALEQGRTSHGEQLLAEHRAERQHASQPEIEDRDIGAGH